MDVLKVALFALLALSLGLMWHERDLVVDAYRQDSDGPAELRLSGVALDFEKTDIPASPYVVHTAPDTRRRPMSLLFTAPEVDPVDMTGGEARIAGFVRIDGVGAAGAVVRLERHTATGIGVRDVRVGADGRYVARNLPGGRYRVRAWVTGHATTTMSDVFFLNADDAETRSFDLEVVEPDPRIEYVNGGTMTVGLTGGFGVVISRNDVDENGLVITVPVPGVPVSAEFSADVSLLSPPVVSTNDRGLAQFRVRCLQPGTGRAAVTVDRSALVEAEPTAAPAPPPADPATPGDAAVADEVVVVALAACVPPPPPPQPPEPAEPAAPAEPVGPGGPTETTATAEQRTGGGGD